MTRQVMRGCVTSGVITNRYDETMLLSPPVVFQIVLFDQPPLSVDWPPVVEVLTIHCRRTLIGF